MADKWYSVLVKENMYGFGSQALGILAGILFAIIIPRILGPESFGYFSLVFALANVSLFFCDFGMATTLMKLIPASIVKKETATYYRFLSRLKYALTAISSVLLFILSDFIASGLFKQPELGFGIKISSLFLFSYSLYLFYEYLFVAVKRNKFVFYVNAIFQSSRIALPLILYYVYRTYTSVLLGLGLAASMGLISTLFLKRGLKFFHEGEGSLDYKTFKKYFFYGAVGYLGGLLAQWMDSIVVGIYINPTEVGFYRIGIMWMGVAWLFIPLSSRVLFALYSEKTESREKDKVSTVYSYSLRYSLIVSLLVMVGMWLTSDYFITFIYGQGYAAAVPVVLILSFLALESSLNAINAPLLQGIGKIDIHTKYLIVVGLLSVAGSIYGSSYGISGVAFAVTSIRAVSMLLLTAYVLMHLKIKISAELYLRPVLSTVLTFLILMPFKFVVTSLPLGLLYAFAVVIVYGMLAIMLKVVSIEEIRKIVFALTER